MNNTTNADELKDEKAERRDEKRRKRKEQMKQHGRDLKKPTNRTASHIAKVEKKKKSKK